MEFVVVYDLYGFRASNLDELAELLALVLNLKWEARESSFIGEYYSFRLGSYSEERLRLQKNYMDDTPAPDWKEEEFKEYPFLLYVSNSSRFDEIKNVLLKSQDLEVRLLKRTIHEEKFG